MGRAQCAVVREGPADSVGRRGDGRQRGTRAWLTAQGTGYDLDEALGQPLATVRIELLRRHVALDGEMVRRGTQVLPERQDVYACAATLHYLVTGRVPPEASERIDDPILESPRAYAPDLPAALSDAIVYGLGFKPEQRPQSARAFADLIAGRQSAPLVANRRAEGHQPVARVELDRKSGHVTVWAAETDDEG